MQDFGSREDLRDFFAENYNEAPEDLIKDIAGFVDGDIIERGWWGLERAVEETSPEDDSSTFYLNCEDWVYKYMERYSEERARQR